MNGPDEYAILRRLDEELGLDFLAVYDDGIASLATPTTQTVSSASGRCGPT